jgi:hypothetical protein
MPRPGTTYERGYDHRYKRVRASILGPSGNGDLPTDPPCSIRGARCTGTATTADHDPPLEEAGFHLNLRPACGPCNYGWRAGRRRSYPPASRSW